VLHHSSRPSPLQPVTQHEACSFNTSLTIPVTNNRGAVVPWPHLLTPTPHTLPPTGARNAESYESVFPPVTCNSSSPMMLQSLPDSCLASSKQVPFVNPLCCYLCRCF
jgi:hypothetical protein